ncbi:DUF4403 family protein [Sphingomonas sp.]|uniref:DUF4403 family protein n=1 Tax=Sphingomonas sp. TaxID=28214 RepID=UPI002BA93070|nr:DUF4403 family protein [Sphingomonas sp.]HTG38814.1 DUF4403 family protein [Sphingomonas sp.]
MAAGIALAILVGCSPEREPVPPRVDTPVRWPTEPSFIALPIESDSAALTRLVERNIPRELWSIDRKVDTCVEGQRVKLFGERIKVTPDMGCTITGTVTRGRIRLRGEGDVIVADVPLNARISARKVGGTPLKETATGTAMAHARIRLSLDERFEPRATVDISYDWREPPGVDFLGQRITFTDRADERLRPIVARLERELPRELARLDTRAQVERIWRAGFATLSLNRRRPPVWLRVTPEKIFYGGYDMRDGRVRLDLGVEALTETVVGDRPAAPGPTPLPALARTSKRNELRLFIPVLADYRQLNPVILRALRKRSRRPFEVPGLGPVTARFEAVDAYGTTGGRIAVGVRLIAQRVGDSDAPTRGTIWLSALPVNRPGSAEVEFSDLHITGDTDGAAGDLLIAVGDTPGVSRLIARELGQNFRRDVVKLIRRIRRAVAEKREGDLILNAQFDRIQSGRLRAAGAGLFLPVRISGRAKLTLAPR